MLQYLGSQFKRFSFAGIPLTTIKSFENLFQRKIMLTSHHVNNYIIPIELRSVCNRTGICFLVSVLFLAPSSSSVFISTLTPSAKRVITPNGLIQRNGGKVSFLSFWNCFFIEKHKVYVSSRRCAFHF